jgi:hypothetical protein
MLSHYPTRAALGTTALVIFAAMMLTAPGSAQAKDNDNDTRECSVATLQGQYVFHASGFNILAGVAQPKAIVELIHFNGDGSLYSPAATVSINGVVGRSSGSVGRYTVTSDCIGAVAFDHGPMFDLFVGFRQTELYLIQTGPGSPVFGGTAERLSR